MTRSHERMTGVDTAWLRMEDPTNLMMITGLIVFDGPMDVDRLEGVIRERLLRFDRFRQRVVQPSGLFTRPRWVDVPGLDVADHLEVLDLPAPAGRAELEEAVSRLMSRPLDYRKPLWAFHVLRNYQEGSALVVRLHHCIADGIALIRVLLSLTDETPDPGIARVNGEMAQGARRMAQGARRGALRVERARAPEDGRLREAASRAGKGLGLAARGLGAVGKLLVRPPDPPTLYRGELGVAKRAAWSAPVDLESVKGAGRGQGATVNDVLLAAMTGAMRRYVLARGGQPGGLDVRAAVPVNLRPPDAPLGMGNRFGLVFLSLPIGLANAREQMLELKRRMDAMKRSLEAVVVLGLLELVGSTTPTVQRLLVDFLARKVTVVATNVPGPRAPRYLAGVRIRRLVPWVPQAGRVGLGLSIISYDGEVTVGVASDAGIVPDPERLLDHFYDAFGALARAQDASAGKGR